MSTGTRLPQLGGRLLWHIVRDMSKTSRLDHHHHPPTPTPLTTTTHHQQCLAVQGVPVFAHTHLCVCDGAFHRRKLDTVKKEVATALHHSAHRPRPVVEEPKERERERERCRRCKQCTRRTTTYGDWRPGILQEPGSQRSDRTARGSSVGGALVLAVLSLAGWPRCPSPPQDGAQGGGGGERKKYSCASRATSSLPSSAEHCRSGAAQFVRTALAGFPLLVLLTVYCVVERNSSWCVPRIQVARCAVRYIHEFVERVASLRRCTGTVEELGPHFWAVRELGDQDRPHSSTAVCRRYNMARKHVMMRG